MFAILGDVFPTRATKAFAFNFIVKGAASALAFVYSLYLDPAWQLVIMGITLVAGADRRFVIRPPRSYLRSWPPNLLRLADLCTGTCTFVLVDRAQNPPTGYKRLPAQNDAGVQ